MNDGCPVCGYVTCPTPEYCARVKEQQESKDDAFNDNLEIDWND